MFKKNNLSIGQNISLTTILIVIFSVLTATFSQYINYSGVTNDIVESTSKEINKQIILNYENYIDSVIQTANYIQGQTAQYGHIGEPIELDSIYEQASEIQEDIVSIVLIGISGNEIVNSESKTLNSEDLTLKQWYIDAISDVSIFHFSSPHIQDIYSSSVEEVITVTKLIDYYSNGVKYQGVLVIDLNNINLVRLAETTNLGDQGHIIILNDDNSLISSSSNICVENTCESAVIAQSIIIGGEKVEINNIAMYANVNTLNTTRWRIATFTNVELIEETRNKTLITNGIILLVTLTITALAASSVSRRISSPVNKLKKHMLHMGEGDFYQRIDLHGQKEIVVLANSFNHMIEEIKYLLDKILVEQRDKRKTEFIALQTQINPHFLYNTLDSIVYLSENKMNEDVVEMVIALSKFFRIGISRGKNIILLSEELEHARNYLLIQKIRYHNKFEFEFEVEDKVKDCKVVKLILQPLIENCINHGINTEYGSGLITIRAYEKDGNLCLEVEDDGYGITDKKRDELYLGFIDKTKAKSVGLRNVYQRLQLYYGEESQFIIDTELDVKTTIRLVISMEREVQDEKK